MAQPEIVKSATITPWQLPKWGAPNAYQPGIEGAASFGGVLCDAYTAIGTEWLNFINRRLHVDLSLPAQMSQCRGPQDFMQEWSKFIKAAAEDYRDEFTKLAEMNTTATKKAAAAFQANGGTMPSSKYPGL